MMVAMILMEPMIEDMPIRCTPKMKNVTDGGA